MKLDPLSQRLSLMSMNAPTIYGVVLGAVLGVLVALLVGLYFSLTASIAQGFLFGCAMTVFLVRQCREAARQAFESTVSSTDRATVVRSVSEGEPTPDHSLDGATSRYARFVISRSEKVSQSNLRVLGGSTLITGLGFFLLSFSGDHEVSYLGLALFSLLLSAFVLVIGPRQSQRTIARAKVALSRINDD